MSEPRYARIWVEITTVQQYTEDRVELPPDWDSKTQDEKDQYLEGCFNELRDQLANGGWDVVEE